jgi:hypothetical protein
MSSDIQDMAKNQAQAAAAMLNLAIQAAEHNGITVKLLATKHVPPVVKLEFSTKGEGR